jgi:hypothetical protein
MPIFSENSGPVTAASPLTITTANAVQQVFPNTKRSYLLVQNTSDTDMWLAIGTTPSVGTGIRLLAGGGGYVAEEGFIPSGAVNIICLVAGKSFYALQGG